MGLVARLFGKTARNHPVEISVSRLAASTREQTRRELVTMAVRDTLKKHGLAPGCITAEGVPGITPNRQRGMQIQLVFRDWQPSLLSYVVALEKSVRSRLQRLDPLSSSWITGVCWRFEPSDPTRWPQLPTTPQGNSVTVAAAARTVRNGSATAALEKLLQSGDAAFGGGAGRNADFSPTLPMQQGG